MRARRKVQNESTKNDPVITALPQACADETAAVEFMEKQRWGDHPACPFCGSVSVYMMMDSKDPTKRQANFRWRCREKECPPAIHGEDRHGIRGQPRAASALVLRVLARCQLQEGN